LPKLCRDKHSSEAGNNIISDNLAVCALTSVFRTAGASAFIGISIFVYLNVCGLDLFPGYAKQCRKSRFDAPMARSRAADSVFETGVFLTVQAANSVVYSSGPLAIPAGYPFLDILHWATSLSDCIGVTCNGQAVLPAAALSSIPPSVCAITCCFLAIPDLICAVGPSASGFYGGPEGTAMQRDWLLEFVRAFF
jgi:hypothetical protein